MEIKILPPEQIVEITFFVDKVWNDAMLKRLNPKLVTIDFRCILAQTDLAFRGIYEKILHN